MAAVATPSKTSTQRSAVPARRVTRTAGSLRPLNWSTSAPATARRAPGRRRAQSQKTPKRLLRSNRSRWMSVITSSRRAIAATR